MKSPIKYPSGQDHAEVYVPVGRARFQQWWCHTMIDQYKGKGTEESYYFAEFYKRRLLPELYRKEYYENNGWDFTFKLFQTTVVEIGPWVRTYHAWIGISGEKVTIQLPRVKA